MELLGHSGDAVDDHGEVGGGLHAGLAEVAVDNHFVGVGNPVAIGVGGESVGQVASQTMGAIVCTDAACRMPVFRPVIGMDKTEIVEIARKIDTFDISIEPYEDCCTVFTPKHPKTKPVLADVEAAQNAFDFEPLIAEAVAETELKVIKL